MNKKILKFNLVLIITLITIAFPYIAFLGFMVVISGFDAMLLFLFWLIASVIFVLIAPLLVSYFSTLKFLKEKKAYKLSNIINLFGIILYSLLIIYFIKSDPFNIFADKFNDQPNTELMFIFTTFVSVVFICPLIINAIVVYKEKNELTNKGLLSRLKYTIISVIIVILIIIGFNMHKTVIINNNKINITENNVYSYWDFKTELKNRNFIYDLPNKKKELSGAKDINAFDSKSKTGYRFSEGTYFDSYTLSANTDRKFPLFVYNSYASLVKKSEKTADYYYIGPQDWYITWYIYYVNGKIYAAISDESEYGGVRSTNLSKTKYGIVVSEEKNITIYNLKKNYYVKGGGILDTRSGFARYPIPNTTDIYNNKCMKIVVVDKVNAKTLDRIAKEISQQQ